MDHDNTTADETLMLRYRDGDARAFEWLYQRHKGGLYRYFCRQCNDRAIADELFQDVWLNIIKARERYSVSAKFTTYLYRVAHNRLIDYYRRQARGLPVSYQDADGFDPDTISAPSASEPERQFENNLLVDKLLDLLGELPEAQREVFLLRQEAGMSLEDIAHATSASRETVKSRLRYAVNKLRQGLTSCL